MDRLLPVAGYASAPDGNPARMTETPRGIDPTNERDRRLVNVLLSQGPSHAPLSSAYRRISHRNGLDFGRRWLRCQVLASRRDVRIRRYESAGVFRLQSQGSRRGAIKRFSQASARRLVLNVRNMAPVDTEVVLTYPGVWFPTDGRKVKRDIDAFLKVLRRRGFCGVWCLEFQERGAPHVHVYVYGRVPIQELAEAWWRIVGSGDPDHRHAGLRVRPVRHPERLAGYLKKSYIAKATQKDVPEAYQSVGRFWSIFGGARPKWEVIGDGDAVFMGDTVRLLRRYEYSIRRVAGWRRPKVSDDGRHSRVAYGTAEGLRQTLAHSEERWRREQGRLSV